jgi:hypothetical protein
MINASALTLRSGYVPQRRHHRMSTPKYSRGQLAIPGDDDEFAILAAQRCCEMHGVVATKRMLLGESSRVVRERLVDTHEHHRSNGCVKVCDRSTQSLLIDPSGA